MSVPVTPRVKKAETFATGAHIDQKRDGGEPYIIHPARVAAMVAELPEATEDMVVAAWLHDVVEDTEVNQMEILQMFGESVADLVDWLTNPTFVGDNRAARKAKIFARLAQAPDEAKRIKMCDRIDNLRDTKPSSYKEAEFGLLSARESRQLLDAIGSADRQLASVLFSEILSLELTLKREHSILRTPRQVALEDVLDDLLTAWELAPCLHMSGSCHVAGVPHGQRCCLCELWGSFCTYKELSGGLNSQMLPLETPFTREQLALLLKSPFKAPNDLYSQDGKP